MGNTVSIKDIARKFKCAPSTISRALNDHPMINIDTRKTIQEYANKVGYQKNTISLSLLNKRSKTLGVIIPSISHYHETAIIEGLEAILQPAGYLLNICVTNESQVLEKEYLDRLVANRVDAICISLSQETFDHSLNEHIDLAISRSLPIIFMDRFYHALDVDRVITDDFKGAFMATEHLIQMGCQRIAHLHGPRGITVSQQRFMGYEACLKKYGREVEDEWVKQVMFSPESAVEATKNLLDQKAKPDGIFAVNDEVGFGAMKVIHERNYKIPEDIALVGFDDIPLAAFAPIALSSVSRQSKKIGEKSAKLFLSKMNGIFDHQQVTLEPELIVRSSSQRNHFSKI
jgi:LacI family transcriptional regulator